MALPDYAALSTGTPIVLGGASYAPTGNNSLGSIGAGYEVLDLLSVAAGGYEETGRFDFGATWDTEFVLAAAIEFATAPTAGETVDFYMAWNNSNDTVGWPGGIAGGTASAAYTGYSANAADSVKQLTYLGSMVCTVQATTTVQIDTNIATFVPRDRWAVLVVHNNTSDATKADHIQQAVRFTPIRTSVVDA